MSDNNEIIENDIPALQENMEEAVNAAGDLDLQNISEDAGEVIIDNGADKIHIADEVITQIIIIAAGRIPGISLGGASVGEGIAGLLGKKGPSRGIRLATDYTSIGVDIPVTVEYGRKINESAKALQVEIRADLTEMTGMDVTHVNVHVLAINTKDAQQGKTQKPARQQKEPPAASDKIIIQTPAGEKPAPSEPAQEPARQEPAAGPNG